MSFEKTRETLELAVPILLSALKKARLVLKTDAELVFAAPELDAELAGIVAQGRATQLAGPIGTEQLENSALVFVATGCVGADVAYHAIAKAAGATVNVVDRPDLCDVTTPSIVDRDPVVVAIGTEGTAPVLARKIKTDVEALLPLRVGAFAALAGRLRDAVATSIPESSRRAFWAWAFKGAPAELHQRGAEAEAAQLLKTAIAEKRIPDQTGAGHISLVGAGPGARDLLTLRAVERLQEADIIFYDRLVDEDVLELGRRDAERVFVGKEVGACAWPQDKICALIVAEARKGRRVVRLKSGDPSIFGRATEEMDAAKSAGIEVEIVPGVTAASAAAASLGQSLTVRSESDTLVIATGTCRPGDAPPDLTQHARPGTTLAVYMGVRAAPRITTELLAAGVSPQTEVSVAVEISTASEKKIATTLSDLPCDLKRHAISGAALILVKIPKSENRAQQNVA
ncbi:MAG: siroheme synthase CysG [Pseudomonadota bacterium]